LRLAQLNAGRVCEMKTKEETGDIDLSNQEAGENDGGKTSKGFQMLGKKLPRKFILNFGLMGKNDRE